MKVIEPKIAFSLRYAYTTWCESYLDPKSVTEVLNATSLALEKDELRLLESRVINRQWQLLVSARPHQSPVEIVRLVKARLYVSMANLGYRNPLNRRFAIRSVGNNTSSDLKTYLAMQVERRNYIDPRFSDALQEYSKEYDFDSSLPSLTRHGKYWYDLHLVLSTSARFTVAQQTIWERLVATCEQWHAEQGEQLKSLALLPDHLHILLRPKIDTSPQMLGRGLIERLNAIKEMPNLYLPSFYVGTYGAYSMAAIRKKIY